MSKSPARSPLFKKVFAHAMAMPGAWEDHPWGETVAKCSSGKVFVFSGMSKDGKFVMAVKLPVSCKAALERDDCQPTPYGMGKHGWVSLTAEPDAFFAPGMLERWVEESWCAVAPKKDVERWMGVADADRTRTPRARTTKRSKAARVAKKRGVRRA